jgi:hypothetical protein
LVIGLDASELVSRIGLLRDPHQTDEELRRRFFNRSRSTKYPRGDTRGWKLIEARALLSADADWQSRVLRCCYRPLDDRMIFWHPRMIDWPRREISEQMLAGSNPALIARRQVPSDPTANFFWLTRWPTVDGILRSDNRGNEYVFPRNGCTPDSHWNFSGRLIEEISQRIRADIDLGQPSKHIHDARHPPCDSPLAGDDVFGFLAALVFSPSYRAAHHAATQHDFMPIVAPQCEATFRQLARRGRQLVRIVTRHDEIDSSDDWTPCGDGAENAVQEFEIRPAASWEGVLAQIPDSILQFRAGQHLVCRKWTKARQSVPLTAPLLDPLRRVCLAIQRIQASVASIEAFVKASGGWTRILE